MAVVIPEDGGLVNTENRSCVLAADVLKHYITTITKELDRDRANQIARYIQTEILKQPDAKDIL